MPNTQIARELYESPRIMNAHLGSVYHTIGFTTCAEAIRSASEYWPSVFNWECSCLSFAR